MKTLTFSLLLFLLPAAWASAQKISVDDALADMDSLIAKVREVHYNPFLHISPMDFNSGKHALLQEWQGRDSISIRAFTLAALRVTALMDDAHSTADWLSPALYPELIPHAYFPLRLRFDGVGVALSQAYGDLPEGTVIKHINGEDALGLYKESLACYGGTAAFKSHFCESIFLPIFLFLKGIHPPYSLGLEDGRDIPLEAGVDIQGLLGRLSPNGEAYHFKELQGGIAYIAYNRCEDAAAFKVFLEKTFEEIRRRGLRRLIIDLRHNSGGDSSLNDLLIPYLSRRRYRQSSGRYWKISPTVKALMADSSYAAAFGYDFAKRYIEQEDGSVLHISDHRLIKSPRVANRFKGRHCVLIGPGTFSSAHFLADAIATYRLSTLIGMPTGEAVNDFGEQIEYQLPNSGIFIKISIAYDIGADGDPLRRDTVQPHIRTERDALDAAREWLMGR